jgi:hypothetical protein
MKGALDSKAALVHAASDRLWRDLDGKSHEVKLVDHDVFNVLCRWLLLWFQSVAVSVAKNIPPSFPELLLLIFLYAAGR